VMAEHGLRGEVIGLACDGTGYGTDGAVWGCEILKASPGDFERLGHLNYAPLVGGDAAIEHPLRMAFGYLVKAYGAGAMGLDLPALQGVSKKDRQLWMRMIERGVNVPPTSGLGRLFDAVSALVGVCSENTYEGQAAIELEAAADETPQDACPFDLVADADGFVISVDPLIREVVSDLKKGVAVGIISAKFHAAVVEFLLASALRARELSGLDRVAVSGGCFQNDILVRALVPMLEKEGFGVYLHRQVPPGDGCISLGQAYVAMHSIRG